MSTNSINYSDGIIVKNFSEEYTDNVIESFTKIWINSNFLYSTIKVTREEFKTYCDILINRAKKDSNTCIIGIDSKLNENENRVVSVAFAKDLYDSSDDYSHLSDKIKTIFAYNDTMVNQIYSNPLFKRYINKPNQILYGLHAGTLDEHVGRECDGESISTRVMNYSLGAYFQLGYKMFVGVSTHPETIRRAKLQVQVNPASLILSTLPYSTFEYPPNSNNFPFKSIIDPYEAICFVVCYPTMYNEDEDEDEENKQTIFSKL
eukprot:TRINITY_DN550_c0_g1_i1.p1 TRINITY_DN550_c0_g1~~TRINITY_DN550_c0_g1_i1.p1  ORF type:complete len:269 (-),score=58.28 TRINITY_DN550_c0_g1_i1:114-899(-)